MFDANNPFIDTFGTFFGPLAGIMIIDFYYTRKGNLINKDIYSLDTILKKISIKKKFFLKIDIEGDEYKILDQIIKNSENLTGLVIEFHDVSRNIKMIETFIQKLHLILLINLGQMGFTMIYFTILY